MLARSWPKQQPKVREKEITTAKEVGGDLV